MAQSKMAATAAARKGIKHSTDNVISPLDAWSWWRRTSAANDTAAKALQAAGGFQPMKPGERLPPAVAPLAEDWSIKNEDWRNACTFLCHMPADDRVSRAAKLHVAWVTTRQMARGFGSHDNLASRAIASVLVTMLPRLPGMMVTAIKADLAAPETTIAKGGAK